MPSATETFSQSKRWYSNENLIKTWCKNSNLNSAVAIMQFICNYLPFSFKGVISKILLQAILVPPPLPHPWKTVFNCQLTAGNSKLSFYTVSCQIEVAVVVIYDTLTHVNYHWRDINKALIVFQDEIRCRSWRYAFVIFFLVWY